MHKTEMDLRDICEMKEKLTSWTKEELEKGKECVSTEELGQVVDMIKDFAEAEEKCWKACYYKTVIAAMKSEDEDGSMGYDNWRYSSGRFAPTGRGHFAGYPMEDMDHTRMPGTVYSTNDSMGYPNMPKTHLSQTGTRVSSRYGYPYDEWNDARRNYTETHSDSDKKMMDHKAMEHVTAAVESVKHIWKEADPQQKEKLKKELQPLLEEINREIT